MHCLPCVIHFTRWPFWHTHFLVGEDVLARCERDGEIDEEGDLWGNGATFDIYWYRDAALLIRFAPDPPVPSDKMLTTKDTGANN
jgi:hypothetical protein